jgi:drug/metabolite transporter (DMT)-like permease
MSVFLLVYLVAVYGRQTASKFREVPIPALIAVAGFFTAGSTLYVTSLTLAGTATVSVIGALSPIFAGRPQSLDHAGASIARVLGSGFPGIGGGRGHCLGGLQRRQYRRHSRFAAGASVIRGPDGLAQALPGLRHGAGHLRRWLRHLPAGGAMGYVFGGHTGGGFQVTLQQMLLLALMGPLQLSIPLIWYAKGAQAVPAVTLTLVAMLDVVLNPLWSWLGVGEVPTNSAFIGGAIIVGAVVISIFGDRWLGKRERAS